MKMYGVGTDIVSVGRIKKSLKSKEIYTYFIQANEKNKNQKITNDILESLLSKNFSRKDCLITQPMPLIKLSKNHLFRNVRP